ncbi:hypothetical protein [Bacillus salipaludis]|uniref:DUF2157 domain-containing protein n=1 Tax=Bacillus salipaludis TaxID=2547811 RepID=A0AA90R969_9BACI|nr:hypothetical protein [Bacillus salipaludis]MDQ6599211.1 hypothetical protein [Bacillus salipaludis]
METNIREERRKIFRQELYILKEKGYVSEAIVETVAKAHHTFHLDLINKEAEEQLKESEKKISVQKSVPKKPQKIKKALSQKEIRESNITWLLNIGVIFLLIGGLFVATSNWESMSSLMKSGSIGIVALLFFGIAGLSEKILHINKTAFAFIILGSLFLPIFILSLGWFGLLGPYLSITGDGRYILGALGSFIPIIDYVYFAKKLDSRLFVWFTYISLTSGFAFLLASLKLEIDLFYLGLMGFNAILIFIYHLVKKRKGLRLFTSEFVPYIQANLVICTLLMLFIYDNQIVYGFNLLLTAVIYLSMMYVSGRKEYHFIFSAMIVYGFYQVIEHSMLESVGPILYALAAFGFMFVPKAIKEEFSLDKVFQVTSAVVSGLAFIYISFEGILLRSGEPSLVLLIAYIIIAANFTYLSHHTPRAIFPYFSSFFLTVAIMEVLSFISLVIDFHFSLTLFFTGFLLFILFGILHLGAYLEIVRISSRDVGAVVMGFAILAAFVFQKWWELGVMLLLLVSCAYLLLKSEKRLHYKKAAEWILPSTFGLSIIAFGSEINAHSALYENDYGDTVNFAIGAILVLLSSFGWKQVKEKRLEHTSLFVSQILYTLAIGQSYVGSVNELWVQPLVLLIGVWMYSYLYKRIGTKWIPFLIGMATLLAYLTCVHALSMKIEINQMMNTLIATMSAVILLVICYLWRNKDQNLSSAFAWIGHILLPAVLGYTWLFDHDTAWVSFVIAIIAYAISARQAGDEWKIKLFLYGCFSSVFCVTSLGMDHLFDSLKRYYEFPITSIVLGLFWLAANPAYKKRTIYYLVPFSLFGLCCTLNAYPFGWGPYLTTSVYTIGVLFFLHKIKWNQFVIFPLFIAFIATVEVSFSDNLVLVEKMLLSGGIGILLVLVGQLIYRQLIELGKKPQEIKLDGYTVIAPLFFSFMYYFNDQSVWTDALPGLLISASIWMQRKRVPENYSVLVVMLGSLYLLQPYYSVVTDLDIPALWDREAMVLPLVVVVILIRVKLKDHYTSLTKPLEWAVLCAVAILLIQDGLASSTIYDAIILGSLSLLSLLAGMFLQIKSYFFIGSSVLLLNVFLQTRPYWGNMPWWGYLLIAGLILITVASTNEWNKQKIQKGETTFLMVLKEKIITKIRKWD